MELLKKAKENHLHVCMETCGFARTELVENTAAFVDIYLFDYKETDPEKHKQCTGEDNYLILKNLKRIDEMGKSIILRCPIIPGYNDIETHFDGIARLANSLRNILQIEIEPYHNLGEGKYMRLGRKYTLSGINQPDEERISLWMKQLQKSTNIKVKKA